jgi:hypothetical protein
MVEGRDWWMWIAWGIPDEPMIPKLHIGVHAHGPDPIKEGLHGLRLY